jgi:protein SCO1/2
VAPGLVLLAAVAATIILGFRRTPADAKQFSVGVAPDASGREPVMWNVPEFALIDQRGTPVTKSLLEKHVWIADFIFTQCTSACPMLTARMRLLQRKLTDPDLRFVSFSVDPKNDTTDELRRYAESWGPDEPRWLLLHTEPKSLQSLADGMRVVVAGTADDANSILHTSLFFLVDSAGGVRGMYDSDDESALQRLIVDSRRLSPRARAERDTRGSDGAGKAHFEQLGCAGCHDNARLAPSLRGIWGLDVLLADGTEARVDAAYVRESILEPGGKLVSGYLASMPSYASALSASEIDDVVDYVRSLSPSVPASVTPAVTNGNGIVSQRRSLGSKETVPGPAPTMPLTGIARDLICGMSVHITAETPRARRDGQEYYFCSDGCRARFLAAPPVDGSSETTRPGPVSSRK